MMKKKYNKKIIFIDWKSRKELLNINLVKSYKITYLEWFFQNKWWIIKRTFTNFFYFLRLLFEFSSKHTIIIAPWWQFWIPVLCNYIFFKKFKIISLSCDSFLSKNTIDSKKKSLPNYIKYFLAKTFYTWVYKFVYCSDVVKSNLLEFWIPKSKLLLNYRERIRNKKRFITYQNNVPNIQSNNILFIWHYYYSFQKRLDILIKSYIEVYDKKKYEGMELNIIWNNWNLLFSNEDIRKFKNYNINFIWSTYYLDRYLENACFYVHPWDWEWFWTVILEWMLSWLIPLVSDKTWAYTIVKKLNKNLVRNLCVEEFVNWIEFIFDLKDEARNYLSKRAREIAKQYWYEEARKKLIHVLDVIIEDNEK